MPPSKVMISSGSVSSSKKLIVDFINTGQGNAVLVSYPDSADKRYMLVDCGSQQTSTSGSAFKHVQSYLDSVVGDNQIDVVVITHSDNDHTIFLPSITQTQNPGTVLFAGNINHLDDKVSDWLKGLNQKNVLKYGSSYFSTQPDADYGIRTDDQYGVQVYTLAANFPGTSNSVSAVLLLAYQGQGIVLTGDAEFATENFILEKIPKYLLSKCTLLLPAHHGSSYSTSDDFLKALDPNFAPISASGDNAGYAQPATDVVERVLKKVIDGAVEHNIVSSEGRSKPYKWLTSTQAIFLTGTNGDIRYITDGVNYRILASSTGAVYSFMLPGHTHLTRPKGIEARSLPIQWTPPAHFPKNFVPPDLTKPT